MGEKPSFSPKSPDRAVTSRMLQYEHRALTAAPRGPMGRWLMGALLLLSAEGCTTLRSAFRDYRSNAETSYRVGMMPVPSSSSEANVPASMLVTEEGRTRADRISPPLPEGARTTTNESASMVGAQLTIRERTRAGRLREAAMGHPELLRSGDRLVIRDEHGQDWLDTSHMETRWWRELTPGQRYNGTDGRQYMLLNYELQPIPCVHDRDLTTAQTPPSSNRRDVFRPQAHAHRLQRDPGMIGLQQVVEHELGPDVQVYYRHEEDPTPLSPHTPGYQEWRSPVVYYLLRTREPVGEANEPQPPANIASRE